MSRRFRSATLLASACFVALAASAPAARGDGDPCLDSPVTGQKLLRSGKLLEAQRAFATCSQRTCPPEVVDACVRFARRVEDALPTVVLLAHDDHGADVDHVQVSIDGADPVDVSPSAISLDPGSHAFVFHGRGRDVRVEKTLTEGEHFKQVEANFGPASAPASTESAAPPAGEKAPPSAQVDVAVDRPFPASAWIVGGIGLAGLASFGVFGALGLSQRSSDHCDVGCSASDKSSVDTELRVADISLGVGIVGLVVATILYATRPAAQPPAVAFSAGPTRGGNGALAGMTVQLP